MKIETFVEQGLSKSFLAWLRDELSTHPVGNSSVFVSCCSSKTDIPVHLLLGQALQWLLKYIFLKTLGFSVPKIQI